MNVWKCGSENYRYRDRVSSASLSRPRYVNYSRVNVLPFWNFHGEVSYDPDRVEFGYRTGNRNLAVERKKSPPVVPLR